MECAAVNESLARSLRERFFEDYTNVSVPGIVVSSSGLVEEIDCLQFFNVLCGALHIAAACLAVAQLGMIIFLAVQQLPRCACSCEIASCSLSAYYLEVFFLLYRDEEKACFITVRFLAPSDGRPPLPPFGPWKPTPCGSTPTCLVHRYDPEGCCPGLPGAKHASASTTTKASWLPGPVLASPSQG